MAVKNRPRIRWAVQELAVAPTDRILEIGFGPGVSLEMLARSAARGRVAGVELSEVMAAQARRRLVRGGLRERVEIEVASVSSLPFPDGSFDKALAVNSVFFWPDPVENLREVGRVLRGGGRLALVNQPHGARTRAAVERARDQTVAWVQEAGFVEIDVREKALWPVPCLAILSRRSRP
jgi:ubiquinone/menaquinone biosynthesis C-methylase UbiE